MKQYTLPRGNGMKFEYYANGRVFRHATLPHNETTTFRYNDFRRETLVTNERGQTRSHFFDEWGNPLAIVEENNATHAYTYDTANPYNRLTKQDPLGLSTQYQYDALGNVTQITQPSSATVQFFDFNGFNQPQRVKDARGNWTLLAYDVKGNLTDEVKLKAGVVPAAGVSPAAGQAVSWVKRAFDAYGNPTGSKRLRDFTGAALANYSSGTGPSVTTAFDASGLYPVSVTRLGDKDGDGVIGAGEADTATLVFDSLGRQKQGIDASWHTVNAEYDPVDRAIRASDGAGKLRDYRYDANGNRILEQLVVNGAQVDSRAWGFDLSDSPYSRESH
ncbi:MAG: hypothetical protein M1283_06495 [Gammaproteobacteria bacterium]|nr:hypothetical protein [Gammaproteobacteria bacterium]